jgi:GDPmannose 4,6-dehydratase
MKKKAFITGITGQDGVALTEHLLSLDYEIHGLLRRNSIAENQDSRIAHLNDKINTYYGDITDSSILDRLVREIQPDEIYNLAAMSHVKVSWDTPSYTLQANGQGVLNMLEAYKNNCPRAKFYQASSSECFGLSVDDDKFQRETTVMNPTSIYGCSKVLGYNMVRHYRRAYNLHACNGILFNHTGIYRSSAFVEAKIVKAACMIKIGMINKLELGNLDSYRDFGASRDYVKAMYMIINHHKADDFVVSTGQTHSVRDICDYVFRKLGMDYLGYVRVNSKYLRPEELPYLKGDCTKLKNTFDWKPEYTFESLFDEMIDFWLKECEKYK